MADNELEKHDKPEKSTWGGKREGAGRKPLMNKEEIEKVKQIISQHSVEVDEDDLDKRTRIEILLEKLYSLGKIGNILAIKEYLDRQMGKSKESVDVTSGGKPIPIYGGVSRYNSEEMPQVQEDIS